jgi:cell division septation protein DedD
MGRNPPGKEEKNSGSDTGGGREWGLFIIGVSVFMFLLGVLVGRGTSPVTFDIPDMEARIHALFAGKQERVGQEAPELAFFEALKQADVEPSETVPVKTQRFPGEKTPLSQASAPRGEENRRRFGISEETDTRPSPVQPSSAPLSSPQTAGREKKPAPPSEDMRGAMPVKPPAPLVPAPSRTLADGGYTIQVAAVKKPEDAALLVRRFRDQGYAAYAVTGTDGEGGVWYRVRVGRFGSRDAAGPVLEKLAAEQVRGFVLRAE